MNARLSQWVPVIAGVLLAMPSAALAQVYRPPAGPTITPYLDYFNAPVSPLLDNYHTYVRPRAELRGSLLRLGTAVNRQNQRLDQLGNDFRQLNLSQAAPTGTGSTFMNYSHYYSGNQQQAYTPHRSAYRGGSSGGGGFRGY